MQQLYAAIMCSNNMQQKYAGLIAAAIAVCSNNMQQQYAALICSSRQSKERKEIFPSDNGRPYLDFACIREFMMVSRRNAEISRPPHTLGKDGL